MRVFDPFTPAERRLALLFFVLSLVGYALRGASCLDPRVEAWLREGSPRRTAAPDSAGGSPPGEAGEEAVAGPPAPPAADPAGGGIDPNRAGRDQLITLPGIGPALAGRILEDRALNGPYRRADDLLRVRGIGPATLDRLRPLLALP